MKELKDFLSNKNAITFAIAIFVAIIYLGFFFLPKSKQLIGSLSNAARIKAQIASATKEWKAIDVLKAQIANSNKRINFYEKKLPQEKDIPAILGYLSGAARRLNVRISEIKPIEYAASKAETYYSVPILLKAECRYHQLGRFLNELEKADRFMKINDLKINRIFNQNGVLQVQLIIVTYVMEQR